MKKTILFLSLLIPLMFISCNEHKMEKLENRIIELENQNADLQARLKDDQIKKITSSYFLTTTHKEYLTVNKEGWVLISLITRDTIPEFDVYSVDENNNRQLIMENLNKTEFNYSFTPTTTDDNMIKLEAEFQFPDEKIVIPILGKVEVKE